MKEKVLCTNPMIWFQRIFVVTLKVGKRTIGMGGEKVCRLLI